MSYFIGQSFPDLILEMGVDVSAGSIYRVLYKKPNGARGHWDAKLNSPNNTQIVYTPGTSDFDQAGRWQLQAYAEIQGTRAYGEVANFDVSVPVQKQIDC